jgi:hypothetical protein
LAASRENFRLVDEASTDPIAITLARLAPACQSPAKTFYFRHLLGRGSGIVSRTTRAINALAGVRRMR